MVSKICHIFLTKGLTASIRYPILYVYKDVVHFLVLLTFVDDITIRICNKIYSKVGYHI